MKDSMVRSQFTSLEEPVREESDCIYVDVSGKSAEVQTDALHAVKQVLARTVAKTHAESSA